LCGEPFAAPHEPHALGGGCLDVDELGRGIEVLGKIRRHGIAMRGDARCLGEHGDVGVDEAVAGLAHHGGDGAQEQPAVGTPVARIGVREMTTDITLAERAEHSVAERVNHHIAVGVRDDTATVGNAHAAEHDMIAVAERVYVEPLAYAHFTGHRSILRALQYARRHRQVGRAGDLDIERRALHQHRPHALPLHRLRLVGDADV
jgi:hypothetical protein